MMYISGMLEFFGETKHDQKCLSLPFIAHSINEIADLPETIYSLCIKSRIRMNVFFCSYAVQLEKRFFYSCQNIGCFYRFEGYN